MKTRSELVHFLDRYLAISEVKDSSWNGVQYEGKDEVGKVGFAVDAGVATFERASAEGADFLIVHHGHFWRSANPSISAWSKRRLQILFDRDITLYAAHLPLDCHPEVGNNVQMLSALGAAQYGAFAESGGKEIGVLGRFEPPITCKQLEERVRQQISADVKMLSFGPDTIATIAALSGAGGRGAFHEAVAAGVDAYLTGEICELYHSARDTGANVLFAGHHATERHGLMALQKVIGERFDIETVFLDMPTGL